LNVKTVGNFENYNDFQKDFKQQKNPLKRGFFNVARDAPIYRGNRRHKWGSFVEG